MTLATFWITLWDCIYDIFWNHVWCMHGPSAAHFVRSSKNYWQDCCDSMLQEESEEKNGRARLGCCSVEGFWGFLMDGWSGLYTPDGYVSNQLKLDLHPQLWLEHTLQLAFIHTGGSLPTNHLKIFSYFTWKHKDRIYWYGVGGAPTNDKLDPVNQRIN